MCAHPLFLVCVIATLATATLHADTNEPRATLTVISSQVLQDHLLLDITLEDYDPLPVLNALHDGLRSEITFVTRVYHPRRGILRIIGERLLAEQSFRYEAYWDIFERRYVLMSEGAVQRFADREDFLRAFLGISRLRVSLDELGDDSLTEDNVTVAAQVRLTPMKLVPALGILSFVLRDEVLSTEWVRCEIPTKELSAINGGGVLCEIDGQHTPH